MVKNIVATSDSSNVPLVLTLLIISGAILIGYLIWVLIKKNKVRKNG